MENNLGTQNFKYDLCIIGGAGHVGLPFGVAFADAGVKTVLVDINEEGLKTIQSGKFPFMEKGGDETLQSAFKKGTLFTSSSPETVSQSKFVVIVVGTPVDQYLNPKFGDINRLIEEYFDHFRDGQVLVLRSTVYPGTTEQIQKQFIRKGKNVRLAFCPERVVQGRAVEESKTLTQIISTFDDKTKQEVTALFKRMNTPEIVYLKPVEAELAKLYSNAWRYIRFAAANQFYMIANSHGLDYHKINKAMKHKYPRNADLPSPGFTAGPCLFKDTMQLAAYSDNHFWLGHSAMLINEGLVNHLMQDLDREFGHSLEDKTIGILGMAFKTEVDDPRDSLSYKIKKIAQTKAKNVLCTDEYVKDAGLVPLDTVLAESDIIILATPHKKYLEIDPKKYPNKKFVDVWGTWHQTSLA